MLNVEDLGLGHSWDQKPWRSSSALQAEPQVCRAGGDRLTPLLPLLEMSEQLTPEEEAEETEAWAKPLSQLWQNRPANFEAEKEFNEAMAQQAPHCAVCMIFQTYHQVSPLCPLCLPRTGSQREAGFHGGVIARERRVSSVFCPIHGR